MCELQIQPRESVDVSRCKHEAGTMHRLVSPSLLVPVASHPLAAYFEAATNYGAL